MVRPLLEEEELKTFQERMQATEELANKYRITYSPLRTIADTITLISIERLDKSSNRLNMLTLALLGLTFILIIVGIASIVSLVKSA